MLIQTPILPMPSLTRRGLSALATAVAAISCLALLAGCPQATNSSSNGANHDHDHGHDHPHGHDHEHGEHTHTHGATGSNAGQAENGGSDGVQDIIDPRLPAYEPEEGVVGALKTAGSDTMVNLMNQWAAGFGTSHPSILPEIDGKGSSTAPPALLEGQVQFGAMSRGMSPDEIERFVERFGYEPARARVAIDCIAIFVHQDNPIESLTFEQLERAFTVAGDDMTWGDMGVTDPAWAGRPVSLYGRNPASGTYKFFKSNALGKNDYKATVKERGGSAGVVQAIADDQYGLGYSGVGYTSPAVKFVPLAESSGDEPAIPTFENAVSGEYPLARFLYVYLNHDPTAELDPLRRGFIRYIYSREGQEAVVNDGEFPVPAEVAVEDLGKLGIDANF